MHSDTFQSNERHQQILLLLPWYLNQSLEPAERKQVENHLNHCMLCKRELDALNKLATAVKQESALDLAAEASFNKIREKLQTAAPIRDNKLSAVFQPLSTFSTSTDGNFDSGGRATPRHRPFGFVIDSKRSWFAIAALLMLAIIPFAVKQRHLPMPDDYYTLSADKPDSVTGSQLRVVFSKSISDADIDALLGQINGHRVSGPNSVGAYMVQLNSGKDIPELVAVIAFLRSHQEVLLAEPVLQP